MTLSRKSQLIDEQAETLRRQVKEASRLKPRWRAVRLMKKLLAKQEALTGDRVDVIETLRLIASADHFGAGKLRKSRREPVLLEAKKYLERAISLQVRLNPDQNARLAELMEELARVEVQVGQIAQGARTMRRAIEFAETVTDQAHHLYVNLPHKYGHLGGFYIEAGQYDAAIDTLHKAISVLEEHSGRKDHDESYYMHEWLSIAHKKKGELLYKQFDDNVKSRSTVRVN